MRNEILASGLCLGVAACGPQAATPAAAKPPFGPAGHGVAVLQVASPAICYPIYHGGPWCRPARRVAWVPGHQSCRERWIPDGWV